MDAGLHEESPRILVVDDEKVIREILSDFLTMEGFLVRTVEDGEVALDELTRRSYNLVISDLKMPHMGGIDLLEAINERGINVLTVIMTGFGTVETAIEAMKKGAYDYILKPFKVEEVVHIVQRGLERQRLQTENIRLKEALSLYKISEAMSQSLSLEHILELIGNVTIEEGQADAVTLLMEDAEGSGNFVEHIRRSNGSDDLFGEINIPQLLQHHEEDLPTVAHGVKAHRFFSKPPRSQRLVSFCSIPLMIRHHVSGMLNLYSFTRGERFTEGTRKMMSILGHRAVVSIENARLYENLLRSNRDLESANLSLEENFRQTIVGFANALEESDLYTRGHSERVSLYSRMIAEAMDLSPQEIETVVLAARIHDIGKIGIPTDMLNKPGALTPDEIAVFREHPGKGRRILQPVPFLRDLVDGAYTHHESWDGSGYPQGLAGKDIPWLGRIIAVADAFDAMTSDRAYRKALPHEAAVGELTRGAGSQFDPNIIKIFLGELERRRNSSDEAWRNARALAAEASSSF
ncbi:MAG: response regulator [Deltaproteobacteria bacterium]|nr:response regulator [Deltaproteobacteria bacterium]